MDKIVVVSSNAEISDEDRKKLEALGYTVITKKTGTEFQTYYSPATKIVSEKVD